MGPSVVLSLVILRKSRQLFSAVVRLRRGCQLFSALVRLRRGRRLFSALVGYEWSVVLCISQATRGLLFSALVLYKGAVRCSLHWLGYEGAGSCSLH